MNAYGSSNETAMTPSNESEMTPEERTSFTTIVIIVLAVVFITIFLLSKTIYLVRQAEVMILERFGRYKKTLRPGLHFVIPIIETPRKINWRYMDVKNNNSNASVVSSSRDRVDLREHVIDFGKQHVITKDTVQVDVDALVYFRITDPRLAVYKIQNLPDAVELLVQSTLRNIIAQMSLDDTFSSRDQINKQLLGKIAGDAERWGVSVTRVEIFNINPPNDIKATMEQQIKAERDRRSIVLKADGLRQTAIIRSRGAAAQMVLLAEGQRASDILLAQGAAQAKMLVADAEANCIAAVQKVIGSSQMRAVDYLTAVQYLNSLKNMSATNTTKVVMVPNATIDGVSNVMALNGQQSNLM